MDFLVGEIQEGSSEEAVLTTSLEGQMEPLEEGWCKHGTHSWTDGGHVLRDRPHRGQASLGRGHLHPPFTKPRHNVTGLKIQAGACDHELDYMLAGKPWAVLSLRCLICKMGMIVTLPPKVTGK